MSVNGLGINQNLWAGIDATTAAGTTQQIFSRAQEKTVDLTKVDLTQFRRQTIGLDFYNAKTSLELQRQITIAQSGINTARVDVSALNSQAAAALYNGANVVKSVEGKLFIPTDNVEVKPAETVEALTQNVDLYEIANLDKDAQGSNPFAYKKQQKEEANNNEKEPLNLLV